MKLTEKQKKELKQFVVESVKSVYNIEKVYETLLEKLKKANGCVMNFEAASYANNYYGVIYSISGVYSVVLQERNDNEPKVFII